MPVTTTRCAWCLRGELDMTADHVFPDSIGGTRDLVVPSCAQCQAALRDAEQEFARRSPFALARNAQIFPVTKRRLKKDPVSGAAEVRYLLRRVFEPADQIGYDEVMVQGGQLRQLPSFELDTRCVVGTPPAARLDPAQLRGRRRANRPEDVDELVRELLRGLAQPPGPGGLVYELPATMLDHEVDREVAADPAFMPRVFRDIRGRLRIRARNPEEGMAFLWAVQMLAQQAGERLFNHSNWIGTTMVPAGAPHVGSMEWNQGLVDRVLAKVIYGVAYLGLPLGERLAFDGLRLFARYGQRPVHVEEVAPPRTVAHWPDSHVAVLVERGERWTAILSVYGAVHLVLDRERGNADDPDRTIAARCERDRNVRASSACEAEEIAQVLLRQVRLYYEGRR